MVRDASQRAIAERPGLAAADHGLANIETGKAPQACQRARDDRNVADLVLGQVTGFRPRIGDQLLAIAVVEFL